MKVPVGQTIEECIRDDVHDLMVKTGRVPRLAYMVNPVDAAAMLARLPFVGGSQIDDGKPTWFEMLTEAGYVRIVADPNHPTGAAHRFIVCKCGGLALYTPGIKQCLNCLTLKPRPYAPGEKMTDRHPDSVIARVVEETIEEAWRRFDREYPNSEIKIGDRVRWWPQVTWLGTPAADARYSDGIMVDRDVIRIESHGPNGWSSKDGLVGDWRSCAGQCVRKLREVSVDTAHGPIKITADPTPNLESVDDTMRPRRGPFDYDVPDYSGILKEPYEQPARPDGFDQRQVDAARAALLAPAPPRYPRIR